MSNDSGSSVGNRPHVITWAAIAAVLAGAILIFDFITKSVGVVERVNTLCCAPAPPPPKVAVTVRDTDWRSQCLIFAFEHISRDFALGRIKLDIKSARGPTPIGGYQAAEILTRLVNAELPASIFFSQQTLLLDVRLQSNQENDSFYIDYCPTINRPGMEGSLTVTPTFLTPTGTLITDLNLSLPAPDASAVTFNISRPYSLNPQIDSELKRRPAS
jgi:hypothetical protein